MTFTWSLSATRLSLSHFKNLGPVAFRLRLTADLALSWDQ